MCRGLRDRWVCEVCVGGVGGREKSSFRVRGSSKQEGGGARVSGVLLAENVAIGGWVRVHYRSLSAEA